MATRIYKTPFAATGDKEALATADQPDGKVSLQAGWTPDYELPNDHPNYRPVGRSEMNGILNEVTNGLGELQLNGFAVWQAIDGGWPLGALVKHGGATYSSLIGNNGDEPGTGSATWVPVLTNNATTTVAGILRLATTAQAQALSDDTVALTPKKLDDSFKGANQSFTLQGFQKVPGGTIEQWVRIGHTSGMGVAQAYTFPFAFPNKVLGISIVDFSAPSAGAVVFSVSELNAIGFSAFWNYSNITSGTPSRAAYLRIIGH